MSAFTKTNSNWCKPTSKKGSFVAIQALPWEIGCKGSGLWLTVPTGFVFDMSVPWCLRWLFNRIAPKYRKAAALHDFALASGWDRVSAAATFSEALRADGIGRWERLALVGAVIVWHWK